MKEVCIDEHVTDKKDRYILMVTLMATCFADALFSGCIPLNTLLEDIAHVYVAALTLLI